MRGFILAAALCLGCSGSDPPADFDCDPDTQRFGTYLQELTPISGSCGNDTQVALVKISRGVPEGCELVEPDEWSPDRCTLTRWSRCGTTELLAVTTQQDARGEVISGTVTLTMPECFGTANVTWTRQ
jgi:hypothetical protein